MQEDLARAQMTARLGEAQQNRAATSWPWPVGISRKAEQAAQQARLALARAI